MTVKPNSKMSRMVRNLPRSIMSEEMMMAHGPNRWWKDKKSRI